VRSLVTLALFAVALDGYAQPSAVLTCVVKEIRYVEKDGSTEDWAKRTNAIYGKEFAGSVFTVDRFTGRTLGKHVTNRSMKVTVLDSGIQEGQYIKILATSYTGYLHVEYLQIGISEGKGSRPFILVDGGKILTGSCRD
jgi:hypothetical protein